MRGPGVVDPDLPRALRALYSELVVARFLLALVVALLTACGGEESPGCLETSCGPDGVCFEDSFACAPQSEADCRNSHVCRIEGRCSLVDGQCAADSRQDCVSSEICGYDGRCSARRGICIATCDADCRASEMCREAMQRGEDCYPSTAEGRCVAY